MKMGLFKILGGSSKTYRWDHNSGNGTYYLAPHDQGDYLPVTQLSIANDLKGHHLEDPGYHASERLNRLRQFARRQLGGLEVDAEFALSQHGRLDPEKKRDREEDSLIALFREGRYVTGFAQYAHTTFSPIPLKDARRFRAAANRLLVPGVLIPPRLDPRDHLAKMISNSDLPDNVRQAIRELWVDFLQF